MLSLHLREETTYRIHIKRLIYIVLSGAALLVLAVPVKAKLDGEYVENLSFAFDLIYFFGTITAVLKHRGVREGTLDADVT